MQASGHWRTHKVTSSWISLIADSWRSFMTRTSCCRRESMFWSRWTTRWSSAAASSNLLDPRRFFLSHGKLLSFLRETETKRDRERERERSRDLQIYRQVCEAAGKIALASSSILMPREYRCSTQELRVQEWNTLRNLRVLYLIFLYLPQSLTKEPSEIRHDHRQQRSWGGGGGG